MKPRNGIEKFNVATFKMFLKFIQVNTIYSTFNGLKWWCFEPVAVDSFGDRSVVQPVFPELVLESQSERE